MKPMSTGRWHGALLTFAVLLAVAAGPPAAQAAPIWERAGPFQACLEGRFEKWVGARAELVVNDDPSAGQIDDAAVAQWTTETLGACRAQSGGGDPESEARFTKHMAHWHQHIYDLAQSIRQKAGPD